MTNTDAPVYIIEADANVQRALASLPGDERAHMHVYSSAAQLLQAWPSVQSTHGSVIVTSDPPDMPAVQLVRALRQQGCALPALLLAQHVDNTMRAAALAAGATDVLDAPLLGSTPMQKRRPRDDAAHGDATAASANPLLPVTIRSMQAGDADIEQAFVRRLSPASRHMRFFSGIKELSMPMLHAFTHPNFPRSCALIATIEGADEREMQIGVARYAPTDDPNIGEFAVVIADDWQGSGVGVRLLRALIVVATAGGLTQLQGSVLAENRRMLRFMRKLGFTSTRDAEDATVVHLERALRVPRVDHGIG